MIDDRAVADLAALIERLEKLTSPDREVDDLIGAAVFRTEPVGPFSPGSKVDKRLPRYTASLDAVIALVERELPGMAWTLGQNVHHRYWVASLNRLNDEGAPESIAWGQSNQPVIALLLALLRAKGGDNG